LILRRNCKNFIFNKANFAVECGRFGEKFNAVKNKIWQLQPRNQSLNKLLDEILLLTISAVVSGCSEWQEIVDFGEDKLSWLRKSALATVPEPPLIPALFRVGVLSIR
jgi:hypothetical protein